VVIDFLLFYVIFGLSVPLASGYYAKTRGYNFWIWSLVSFLLPIIGMFIILLLPDKVSKDLKGSGMGYFEEEHMESEIKGALEEKEKTTA